MSVQSNITRIEGGKASLKTSINNKLNSTQQKITNEHIEDYHLFVDQISGGGGVGTLEIYENGVYDVSDYANVYVKITELVPCTSISFNKSESTILPDETDTIIATYTPTETTDAIVWNSDNVTVATVTRVAGTDSAVITYVGAGTCHITATCGSFSVSCTVSCDSGEIHCTSITLDQHTLTLDEPVQEKPCTAITLDKSTVSVGTGETVTVTATLTPSDTTDTLTVTSSDTTKATVTLSGNVATITGVADGSSNITFTCGDISEVCLCTVQQIVRPTQIRMKTEINTLLSLSDSIPVESTFYPATAVGTKTYQSSDTSKVIVDAEGNCTAVADGSSTITVSCDGCTPQTCTINVNTGTIADASLIFKYNSVGLNTTGTKWTAESGHRLNIYKVNPNTTYEITSATSSAITFETSSAKVQGAVAIPDIANFTELTSETTYPYSFTTGANANYLYVDYLTADTITLTSNSIPVSSVKVSGQYNKLLLNDVDGTKKIEIIAIPSPTNTTVDKSTAIITPADSTIVTYNGDCSGSASNAFYYNLIPQHKAGSTTFTFSLGGKSDSGTRTVEIVDKASYDDGELIKTDEYRIINANYTNHIGQYSKSTAYKMLLYKVTAGNSYILSGTQHSGTAYTVVHVLGNWSPYLGDLSNKYPLIGDASLFKDDDQTVHTVKQILTMPTGANYVCVVMNRLSDLSLSLVTPYTKFDAIIEEVNMTLNDTISSTYWSASPSTASDVINATQTDSSVATLARNTDSTFSITPSAVGTTTITYSPQTTPALTATSKINVVNEINDMCMLGAYRTHKWSRNSSTGSLSYQRVAKMKGYVFKVTPGDSYTVTYSKGDSTHDLHIFSGDTMVYSSGATGGSVAQNSTELVIERYPVTVVSHTVTIPTGQPYLFVSFIDSAEITLTKN